MRVLARLGFGDPARSYAASYRQAQAAAIEQLPATVIGCQRAHQLLRRHRQVVCRPELVDPFHSAGNAFVTSSRVIRAIAFSSVALLELLAAGWDFSCPSKGHPSPLWRLAVRHSATALLAAARR